MPVAFPQLFKTRYDWDFATEPEPGLGGRRVYLPRGRTPGGSSAINAMVYIRGNAADFDGWADDEGAPGWSYREGPSPDILLGNEPVEAPDRLLDEVFPFLTAGD